jgi:hypothetical protein
MMMMLMRRQRAEAMLVLCCAACLERSIFLFDCVCVCVYVCVRCCVCALLVRKISFDCAVYLFACFACTRVCFVSDFVLTRLVLRVRDTPVRNTMLYCSPARARSARDAPRDVTTRRPTRRTFLRTRCTRGPPRCPATAPPPHTLTAPRHTQGARPPLPCLPRARATPRVHTHTDLEPLLAQPPAQGDHARDRCRVVIVELVAHVCAARPPSPLGTPKHTHTHRHINTHKHAPCTELGTRK